MSHTHSNLSQKTTVQPKKATEGSKEKEDTHTQAKPIQSQENHSTARKGDRGQQREGRDTLKQNQFRAKKTAIQPPKVIEGGKEEWTLKTNPKEITVQPKQRRPSRPREWETHIRTTKDRNGRNHQRLYRYSQKLPNDDGSKRRLRRERNRLKSKGK